MTFTDRLLRRTNGEAISQPRLALLYRFFLRRRSVDAVLLSIAIACFPVKLSLDMILIGLFLVSGIYLIVRLHRSVRLIDPYYAAASLAYAVAAVAIGLYQGSFEANLRWIGMPLYFALGIPLFTGFVLIQDPLRQMAIGARAGLLLTLSVAIFESTIGQARFGLGGNAASAAFIICAMAVLARFHVSTAPRYLPNTRMWFYLALIPALMTGTRSVIPIFVIAALIDVVELRNVILAEVPKTDFRRMVGLCLIGVIVISAVAYQTGGLVMERIAYTVVEMDSLSGPEVNAVTGLSIRLTLWKGAAKIFLEHPLFGLGGEESMRLIKEGIPEAQRGMYAGYTHVHFFLLDELRTRGLIGLVFMLGFFAVTLKRIFGIMDRQIHANTLIFISLVLFYGSLHGLFLSDRNVAVMVLMFTALLAKRRNQDFAHRLPPAK